MILTRLQADKLIEYLDKSIHGRNVNPTKKVKYIDVAYKIMEYAENVGGIDYTQATVLINEMDRRFRINSPAAEIMYLYIVNAIMETADTAATRWGMN